MVFFVHRLAFFAQWFVKIGGSPHTVSHTGIIPIPGSEVTFPGSHRGLRPHFLGRRALLNILLSAIKLPIKLFPVITCSWNSLWMEKVTDGTGIRNKSTWFKTGVLQRGAVLQFRGSDLTNDRYLPRRPNMDIMKPSETPNSSCVQCSVPDIVYRGYFFYTRFYGSLSPARYPHPPPSQWGYRTWIFDPL